MLSLVAALLLSQAPAVPAPACKTVNDCWLDAQGHAIERPKKHRGKKLPKPDCGNNILWLRNELTCEQNVCVAVFRGDRC
jgi:hypothetical protein